MPKIPSSNHKLKKTNRAFTLIEVLVGIAVVGFFAVIAIEMFSTVATVGETSEDMSIALNLAQERIEQIRHLVKKGVVLDVGAGSHTGDDFLPDLSNVSTSSYLGGNLYLTESNTYRSDSSLSRISTRTDRLTQVTWAEGEDTYKKVQVTVFWQERGQTKWVGLVGLIRE